MGKRDEFLQELRVAEFVNDKNEEKKFAKERYAVANKSMKRARRSIRNRKKEIMRKSIIGAVGSIAALTAILGISGHEQKTIRMGIEQAVARGETAETLGLTNETINEYMGVKEKLSKIEEKVADNEISDNLDAEIKSLAPEISSVQFDVYKNKLSNALNISDIELYARNGDSGPKIKAGDKVYTSKYFGRQNDTISNDMGKYIDKIVEMQDFIGDLQDGKYNRESTLNMYESQINSFSELAASEFEVDSNGNIKIEWRTLEQDQEHESNGPERKEHENDEIEQAEREI